MFMYYAEDYGGNHCSTIYKCFWVSFDITFKEDGGVGGGINAPWDEEGKVIRYGRVALDQLGNFILLILIIELLAGLIIDTFGGLRDETQQQELDLNNNCIVCGNTRESIERDSGQTFENHISTIHNLWNYIMFIAFIHRKPQDELNGPESYIYDKFQSADSTWFPYFLYIYIHTTLIFIGVAHPKTLTNRKNIRN